MNNIPIKKRKNPDLEIYNQALEEVEALLEQGVAPRPPKKTSPKKAPAPKKTVKKNTPVKKTYRIDSLTFLITVPQWEGEETLQELLDQTVSWFGEKGREVKEAIIAIEDHGKSEKAKGHEEGEDPGRHIHACVKLDKKICTRNTAYFDTLYGKHGKVETCRDYKACQIYCNKDGNVITKNVDIEAVIESTRTKKGVKHETVANFIRKKERTIKEVDQKFPGYMIQHQGKVKDYCLLQESFRSAETEPYYGIDQAKTMMLGRDNPALIQLVSWLNENLDKPREYRQKQLWLHGKSGVGKSTLINELTRYFNAYHVASEDKWWSGMDSTKQIILFDEYTGYKTISDMKRLLDGSIFPMPQKYATQPFIKRKNIPIIICSNSTPEQIYHHVKEEKPQEFEPLMERLTVIELTVKGTQVPWLKAPPVLDESPDEDEREEVLVSPTPEPPHRPGTPPIKQRVLKRGKPLRPEQLIEEVPPTQVPLECEEELDMSQDSVEDPQEDDVYWNEEPEDPKDISQHSQEERILKAKALYKNYNK